MRRQRHIQRDERTALGQVRALADQAFSRAAGAPLIPGNHVRLLKDARENYPAWLEAIRAAKDHVHFENYIVHDDETGASSRTPSSKARAGVRVRLLYDWLGGSEGPRAATGALRAAGVEVRCYNPPRLDSPLGWLSRDHRKMIGVDGAVGFVTGLCVGRTWAGTLARDIEPWRDTGVEIRGPAVARDREGVRAHVGATGPPFREERSVDKRPVPRAMSLRIVATEPTTAGTVPPRPAGRRARATTRCG